MEGIAGLIAPSATMIAAMMTAANLGARITGWGFVVFVLGSLAWVVIAITTGQQNLLWTNGFLTLVNIVGVWRWLGRQARYDDGGRAAAAKSAQAPTPTLFSLGSLAGRKVIDPLGKTAGTVVDGMMDCDGGRLAYLVITDGGLAGVGERLFALSPDELSVNAEGVTCFLAAESLLAREPLEGSRWPAALQTNSPIGT